MWLMRFSMTMCFKMKQWRKALRERHLLDSQTRSIFSSAPTPISGKSKTQGTCKLVRKGCQITQHPPLWGAISPHSRRAETPHRKFSISSGRSFPRLQRSYPSHQLCIKRKSRQKACVILHPQFLALLFLFILKQMWEGSQSSEQHAELRSSEPFSRFR